MAGDFSRNSVNKAAGYTGVLMQQGRVQLDADWNEQLAIAQHRTQTETRDVIGCCGTPKGEDGFRIEITPDGADFFIYLGRFYAGGLLCENNSEWVEIGFKSTILTHKPGGVKILIKALNTPFLPSSWLDGRPLAVGDWVEIKAPGTTGTLRTKIVSIGDDLSVVFSDSISAWEGAGQVFLRRAPTYLTQPFYPGVLDSGTSSPLSSPAGGELQLPDGEYLVYLEAWQREVNALEDPHIREVALGGPDTAERLQTVWQVKMLRIGEQVELPPEGEHRPCQEKLPEWAELISAARTTGRMNARSNPPQPDANPCVLPPSAGFTGLENQLYRVEIFQSAATLEGATYVWSRDNAMVETDIVSVDSANTNVITVNDLGKDDLHSFSVNDWVEVVDRDGELNGSPRFLAQIVAPAPTTPGNRITLSASVPNPAAINTPGTNVFRLRRWDMTGSSVTAEGIPMSSGWLTLESGVQVNFTEGAYVSRSYWLIPARTATTDIEWPPFQVPNTKPVPQPPLGDCHHFCRLALLDSVYGKWSIGDCRLQFPPLTNICADDVCYQSTCDGLEDAETVKDALDKLCEEMKLRFHKKYLHGWGIVCDLQVRCGGDDAGATVIVNRGYAIDCQGNDILLRQPATFDVLSNINTASGIADGSYSLFFDTGNNNQLAIEPYTPPANPLANALKGTFWTDYYKEYLQPLVDVWRELGQIPPNAIVKQNQRVLSSLTNLLVQLAGAQNGSQTYISPLEHDYLVNFYSLLSGALRDNTFCAIRGDMRPLPDYPAAIGQINSGFGEGFKTRLRLNDAGSTLATVGNDNTIHIYSADPGQPVLQQILTFPGDASLIVKDVALPGGTLYAIAASGGNSVIAFTSLNAVSWTSIAVQGVTLASLAVLAGVPYATGVGKGLYSCQTGALAFSFNSIGQLVAASSGNLFATANSTPSVTTQFNEVISFAPTPNGFSQQGVWTLPQGILGTPDDDLSVVITSVNQVSTQRIYVTATPAATTSNSVLLVNYSTGVASTGNIWAQADMGTNTHVRLAYQFGPERMLVSFAGGNRIAQVIETTGNAGGAIVHTVAIADAFPAEATPMSLAHSLKAEATYILNGLSNTVSVISIQIKPWTPDQFTALANYRTAMIEAYLDLLAVLLQYLKDAFCDLLLLRCRVCEAEENDKPVYLAGVTVKNGRVWKVCNLTQRRYVKTFPGVEYWLSIVPILPIVELALREFCCLTFTNLFSNTVVQQGNTNTGVATFNLPSTDEAYTAVQNIKKVNFASLTTSIGKRISPIAGISTDYARTLFTPPAPAPSVAAGSVAGQPVAQAQQSLAQQGVTFNVAQYNPTKVASNIFQASTAPQQIAAGSAVTLYTDQTGKVKYFSVAPPDVQQLQTKVTAVQEAEAQAEPILISTVALSNDVAALKTQLAARDAQIAQLTASSAQFQIALADLRTQIAKIPITPPKTAG
jgi:Family of unknown function (DUF6519)